MQCVLPPPWCAGLNESGPEPRPFGHGASGHGVGTLRGRLRGRKWPSCSAGLPGLQLFLVDLPVFERDRFDHGVSQYKPTAGKLAGSMGM
jgi:hypothetical protein